MGKTKGKKEAEVVDEHSTSRGAPGDEKKSAVVHLLARALTVFLWRQLSGLRREALARGRDPLRGGTRQGQGRAHPRGERVG